MAPLQCIDCNIRFTKQHPRGTGSYVGLMLWFRLWSILKSKPGVLLHWLQPTTKTARQGIRQVPRLLREWIGIGIGGICSYVVDLM